MEIINTNQLLDNYYKWLQKSYSVKEHKTSDEIVTPFLDCINDNISIFVDRLSNNNILLNDDGYTLNNLEMLGINLTSTRREILNSICYQYNLKIIENSTLAIEGSEKDFPIMKYKLTSAILKINDLVFTKKPNVEKMFFDDVINYFEENDFGGLPTNLVGQSGVTYNFKYAIPKYKNNPLRLITIQNNISSNQIMLNAFRFGDIKSSDTFHYSNTRYIIIFNDKETSISEKVRQIADAYSLELMPWHNKKIVQTIKSQD